ncbi:MAG: inorganic phosphate transporter [Planctomycetota bacterium]|nr:inorganic phosphate transporter [Planctomycetota bacterium]
MERSRELTVKLGAPVSCQATYGGQLMGVRAAPALDSLHYVSAGAVSFARGLNDTPKIAALLLLVPALGTKSALALVGVAIAVGGVLAARRVAQTMSYDITPMNPGQGFTANLVTAFLVIVASRFGLPVSTTHVSCGSLFGLGIVRRGGSLTSIGPILLAWVFTLPLAGGIAWVTAQV